MHESILERWRRRWHTWTPNAGRIEQHDEYLRLALDDTTASAYSDAQLDDYGATGQLDWRPPLTLTVRARLGGTGARVRGTAGFGLWNDPGGSRRKRLALPRAIWFFYASPPSNIALDSLVPGYGWKAMTFDAARLRLALLAPFAPLALLLMQVRWLRQALWPIGQWALGVREALVPGDASQWHTYRIEWLPGRARFSVDDVLLLDTPLAPRGPLGLVLWIDNQYAIVTPRGQLGGGLLAAPGTQWLDLMEVTVSVG